MAKTITISCEQCGAATEKQQWSIEHRKHLFCSQPCHDQWRREHLRGPAHHQYSRVTLQCNHCGAAFDRNPYQVSQTKQHFCSKPCHDGWMRAHPVIGAASPRYSTMTVQCGHCGKDLKRQPWQANSYQRQFCGKECYGAWLAEYQVGPSGGNWRGGHQDYYGPDWVRQRRKARKRDKYTCQRCGMSEVNMDRELDVHHIRPFREFGYVRHTNDLYKLANDLSNLVTLCVPCHKAVEWKT